MHKIGMPILEMKIKKADLHKQGAHYPQATRLLNKATAAFIKLGKN